MIARHPTRAGQRGFSLIELLVAMAIGLLLTLLVSNLFIASRSTNTTTDEVSRMQENIRFAYQLMTRSVRHAGYRSDPSADTSFVFAGGTPAITGTEGGGALPDTLTISFQGSGNGAGANDSSVTDCLGTAFDQGITVVNTFSIAPGANGAPALFCTSNAGGVVTLAEVVPDVDNMQILYGEDLGVGSAQDFIPDHFVKINQVVDPTKILAIRIGLLFSTSNPAAAAAGGSSARPDFGPASYDVNGTTVAIVPADKQIRRPIVWNINLRNRSPY